MEETGLIEAASGQCRTMADGTLRIVFDVEPRHAAEAFKLFSAPGTPAVLGRLRVPSAGPAEPEKPGGKVCGERGEILERGGESCRVLQGILSARESGARAWRECLRPRRCAGFAGSACGLLPLSNGRILRRIACGRRPRLDAV
jgi:hypothetical protein